LGHKVNRDPKVCRAHQDFKVLLALQVPEVLQDPRAQLVLQVLQVLQEPKARLANPVRLGQEAVQ